MASNWAVISTAAFILFGAVIPISAQQSEPSAGGEAYQKVQSEFAEAYNRKDVAAMAAFFAENSVRITPSGIFQGRDTIRSEMQRVIELGDCEGFGIGDFEANAQLQHLLPYASRATLPSPMQGLLPVDWLAFTGRESNPLDRYERFQFVERSSTFPALLTLPIFIGRGAPFTISTPEHAGLSTRPAMLYSLLPSGADGTWR